jgi:hypothetical protein
VATLRACNNQPIVVAGTLVVAAAVAAAKVATAVAAETVVSLVAEKLVAKTSQWQTTRQWQTTVATLGVCNNQLLVAAGTLVVAGAAEMITAAAELLAVGMAVAALPQCNNRGVDSLESQMRSRQTVIPWNHEKVT